MSTRENIGTALLATLAAAAGVAVASRRFTPIDEVAPGDMPYLILLQDQETEDNAFYAAGGQTSLKKLHFKALLYALGDGTENSLPITQLNNMVDAIETALRSKAPIQQQLNVAGIQWASINGTISFDGGSYGNLGVALIPLEVAFT